MQSPKKIKKMGSRKFCDYYRSAVTKPKRTFEGLIQDKSTLRFSVFAVSITALLYTFVYVFLIFGGGQPFKPWLNISLETYYRYNVFFCAPTMFLGWILAAGVVHLLSRLITNAGTFEQTLSVFGFGISIASWTTGIHDFVTSFLGGIHVISQHNYEIMLNTPTVWRALLWILMILYLTWFLILFSKGVKAVYSIAMWKAGVLGTIGFITYQLFFFVFNR